MPKKNYTPSKLALVSWGYLADVTIPAATAESIPAVQCAVHAVHSRRVAVHKAQRGGQQDGALQRQHQRQRIDGGQCPGRGREINQHAS
eukprot:237946-Pelagomonas_calceolata.AAC.1